MCRPCARAGCRSCRLVPRQPSGDSWWIPRSRRVLCHFWIRDHRRASPRARTKGSISIRNFYGRRIRRILPAATLVLVATLFAVYHYLGFVAGAQNADDAKWVAAFLGNVHFASLGTQYLTSTLPPSAFQQYWSLAVEEQFYLLWPLLFLALTAILPRVRPTAKLVSALGTIIIASLAWCIIETSHNEVWAFFSLFTHAWELALGAVLAVLVPVLSDERKGWEPASGSSGSSSFWSVRGSLSPQTPWPGSATIVPVFATGLVILGGTLRESSGFGVVTNFLPVQWVGNISYSLYLVHWPVLVIAMEYSVNGTLPRRTEVELVALSRCDSRSHLLRTREPNPTFEVATRQWVLDLCDGSLPHRRLVRRHLLASATISPREHRGSVAGAEGPIRQ